MAVGKKKVIVYTDWIEQFKDLTDEEAGKLIKHFFQYVNDLNPKSDRLTELLFNPIKATLKRDLKAWEDKQQTNRENGAKGGRPRKEIETQNNPKNPVGFLETQNNPEKGDSVSVSVSVNDNVNDNVINTISKEIDICTEKTKKFDFKKALLNYGFDSNLVSEWLQVRKVKRGVNTVTAFEKFIEQVELSNLEKNKILEECVSRSWSGFKNEWLNNNTKQNGTETRSEHQERGKQEFRDRIIQTLKFNRNI